MYTLPSSPRTSITFPPNQPPKLPCRNHSRNVLQRAYTVQLHTVIHDARLSRELVLFASIIHIWLIDFHTALGETTSVHFHSGFFCTGASGENCRTASRNTINHSALQPAKGFKLSNRVSHTILDVGSILTIFDKFVKKIFPRCRFFRRTGRAASAMPRRA